MSLGKHKFQKAFESFSEQKRDEENLLSGILGLPTGIGQNTVEVDGRIGFVYVRLRDNLNEVIQAYNDKVSPVYGLPVLIGRDKTNNNYYRIVTRDVGRYQNWGTISPYLPKHGNQHRFKPEIGGGGDVVWVEGRQFVPLALTPSGTVGAGNVLVEGSHFYTGGEWHWAGDTGTPDIISNRPTNNKANVVLVYIDGADNNPKLLVGDEFDASISGTSNIIPFLPPVPDSEDVPLGAVRLVSGTERIAWEQIYDLRPYIVGSAYIPTGTYGHIIRDEGIDLPKRSYLNFIGTNVWAVDDPANNETEIIISGTAGGGDTRRTIKDEGVAEADRDNLNFVGNGVFVRDDVPNNELEIIISGSSSRYGIRDDGSPEPQRSWLNFVGAGVSVNDDPANHELEIIITGSVTAVPGGISSYVQYNSAGTFAGSDGFQWNNALQKLTVGGRIQLGDGTEGSPSYTFISDYNLGLYRDGSDILGISAGGVVQAKVHTDKVEILRGLNVSGTSNLNGAVFIRGVTTLDSVLDMNYHNIVNVAIIDLESGYIQNIDFLKFLDTDESHSITFSMGSDISADRTFSLVTGDANRVLTLQGDPTLNDWFDQGVKQADSPTFGGLRIDGTTILDHSNTGTLVVRKDGAGGDVLIIDTINSKQYLLGQAYFGDVGFGMGNDRITIRHVPVDDDASEGIILRLYQVLTGNGNIDNSGFKTNLFPTIPSGVTNSGNLYGLYQLVVGRTNEPFEGTLASIYGQIMQVGLTTGIGTITNAYGLSIEMQHKNGTITNSYGIRIDAPQTGGTVTNEWAIYVEDDAPNYFEGYLGLGIPNPLSPLHIDLATEDLEIVDAGSAGATEQGWIEFEVGGVQGFIHVRAGK